MAATTSRAFWNTFGVGLALYVIGRVVTTIGSYLGSRTVAVGFVIAVCAVLEALAMRFPRAAAIGLTALAGLQSFVWIRDEIRGVDTGAKQFMLIALNGGATVMGLAALRVLSRVNRVPESRA